MADDPRERVTAIVGTLADDEAALRGKSADELAALLYDELRGLARSFMARERRDHTLQATALVHEAYIRMVDQTRVDWQGSTHFRAVGARVMRRILVDHARRHASAKRGGGAQRVTLGESLLRSSDAELDLEELLTVNAALDKLRAIDERQEQVVELRFFGGLGMDHIAEVLGVSKRTVEADWTHGRAWLKRELSKPE